MSGAAVAFARALREPNTSDSSTSNTPTSTPWAKQDGKLSPSEVIHLRMKNFEQLKYIQQLFKDDILTEEEFLEQKKSILSSIKQL